MAQLADHPCAKAVFTEQPLASFVPNHLRAKGRFPKKVNYKVRGCSQMMSCANGGGLAKK